MMGHRMADWLARYEILAMFGIAIWTWPSTPAQIPIHWNIAGQVDGYGSKLTGLLLLPIIATAGYVLLGFLPVLRPEQFDGRVIGALSWFRLAYVVVMAGAFVVIAADSRGANINMNYVMFPVLALMMIASVNLVVQLSRLKSSKAAPPDGGIRI
jgi:uncharacterized membrane protein